MPLWTLWVMKTEVIAGDVCVVLYEKFELVKHVYDVHFSRQCYKDVHCWTGGSCSVYYYQQCEIHGSKIVVMADI